MTTKVCTTCKQEKVVSEFYKSNVRYYQHECKMCCKERRSAWYKTEKGKRSSANTKLKSRFGVTIEKYEEEYKKQNGKCALCRGALNTLNHRLGFDHNHITGQIRALLCKPCNLGIAHLKESPELCETAAKYLRTYENI